MEALPLRLLPDADLRTSLQEVVASRGLRAAFLIAGIGSLRQARVRLAGAAKPITLAGDLEILTLSGSVGANRSHLHMSIADAEGRVIGGHVAPGCIVRTTAEILVLLLPELSFSRDLDPTTGYAELVIQTIDPDATP